MRVKNNVVGEREKSNGYGEARSQSTDDDEWMKPTSWKKNPKKFLKRKVHSQNLKKYGATLKPLLSSIIILVFTLPIIEY